MLRQKNVLLYSSALDIEQAMSIADAAICHGGLGTVTQAACTATPLFVMPRHAEQLMLARRLEQQRRAVALPFGADATLLSRMIVNGFADRASVFTDNPVIATGPQCLSGNLADWLRSKLSAK